MGTAGWSTQWMWFSGHTQPRLISWHRWPWRDVSILRCLDETHISCQECVCVCVCVCPLCVWCVCVCVCVSLCVCVFSVCVCGVCVCVCLCVCVCVCVCVWCVCVCVCVRQASLLLSSAIYHSPGGQTLCLDRGIGDIGHAHMASFSVSDFWVMG